MSETTAYDYYVALITVTATEEAGLRYIYDDWKELLLDGDTQKYYETSFERDGKKLKVVTARQSEMGMTAAGVLTMKLIAAFRPKYVIMVGIAAGIAHRNAVDQVYGDIVVPNVVWDYSSGKFVAAHRAIVTLGDVGYRKAVSDLVAALCRPVGLYRTVGHIDSDGHVYSGECI